MKFFLLSVLNKVSDQLSDTLFRGQSGNKKKIVFTYFLGIDEGKFDRDDSEATGKEGSCLEVSLDYEDVEDGVVAAQLQRSLIEMLEHALERQQLEIEGSVDGQAAVRVGMVEVGDCVASSVVG